MKIQTLLFVLLAFFLVSGCRKETRPGPGAPDAGAACYDSDGRRDSTVASLAECRSMGGIWK